MLDYRSYLSQTLSRKKIDFFVQELANEPNRVDELLFLIDDADHRLAWHAAWALQIFFQKYPEFFSQRIRMMLTHKAIATPNESLRRLTFGMVAFADLPEELPVPLINACFDWILSAHTSIAVKAGSIHYLLKVCKREPDLLPELRICVGELLQTSHSGAFLSVARKVFKD